MITVKGVEVRSKEIDLEVSFQDLTPEGQKRIFLENKEKFLIAALNSRYSSLTDLVKEVKNECSSFALNKAIEHLLDTRRFGFDDLILEFLSVPSLELSEKNRKKLAYSEYWRLKLWVAKDEKTPLTVLKTREMFFRAAQNIVYEYSSEMFDAIVTNPNFDVDEEIEQTIQGFSSKGAKKIKARIAELKK